MGESTYIAIAIAIALSCSLAGEPPLVNVFVINVGFNLVVDWVWRYLGSRPAYRWPLGKGTPDTTCQSVPVRRYSCMPPVHRAPPIASIQSRPIEVMQD